jgi:hypothetical protein
MGPSNIIAREWIGKSLVGLPLEFFNEGVSELWLIRLFQKWPGIAGSKWVGIAKPGQGYQWLSPEPIGSKSRSLR